MDKKKRYICTYTLHRCSFHHNYELKKNSQNEICRRALPDGKTGRSGILRRTGEAVRPPAPRSLFPVARPLERPRKSLRQAGRRSAHRRGSEILPRTRHEAGHPGKRDVLRRQGIHGRATASDRRNHQASGRTGVIINTYNAFYIWRSLTKIKKYRRSLWKLK